MKELKTDPGWDWDAWFWLDREEFEGEWKAGQCRYRVEKAVGRDTDGRLFLMEWTNHDKFDWHKFTQVFHEIDFDEYLTFLDRAVAQGEVKENERERLTERAEAPFTPPWDIHKAVVVYRDDRYTLGQRDDRPYLVAGGRKFVLSCHPYEPCLYITDEGGSTTAVHNAFDPFAVLESFSKGETIDSITGRTYSAGDFCRMVEYAAGMADINIDDAEKVFGTIRGQGKTVDPAKKAADKSDNEPFHPETKRVIYDDPCYSVIDEYPDRAVEFCLVKNEHFAKGRNAHRDALMRASRELFFDGKEQVWRYDCGDAEGKQINTDLLFAAASEERGVNYRGAFSYPPYGVRYSDSDFDRVNAALFPNGTDVLEVYEWTTGWSEYFDDGHEWWGALCYTVYDKSLDRFVVIMASATD